MNEKQTAPSAAVRPTKKQRELLTFIGSFITAHGYSPSYREIMTGLGYTSVATVALHIKSLIARGHLRKRDYSARSLELVEPLTTPKLVTNEIAPAEEKWLIEKVEHLLARVEQQGQARTEGMVQDAQIVVAALHVLGLEAAAQSFQSRLRQLKKQ